VPKTRDSVSKLDQLCPECAAPVDAKQKYLPLGTFGLLPETSQPTIRKGWLSQNFFLEFLKTTQPPIVSIEKDLIRPADPRHNADALRSVL